MEERVSSNKGEILKKARESQGLSLETVHEATKIPMDSLRAIEDGYTIGTLSPFYYKGFVKIYAQYLNVDAGQILNGQESGKNDVQPSVPSNAENRKEAASRDWPLEIQRRFLDFFTRRRKQHLVIGCGILLVVLVVVKIAGFFAHRPSSSSVKSDQAKVTPPRPVRIDHKENQRAPRTSVPAQAVPAANFGQSTAEHVTLTVRAKKRSWLRVESDGNVVFQSALDVGAVETWKASDRIEISGRNINQLEFEVNGKLIGVLGRQDRNAKTVVVTKNGLSVTR